MPARTQPIATQSLADLTYERVRDRILAGEFAPGAALRQDVIAAELGVSKIPVREAFGRLEQDGLVQLARNRGYRVRPVSAAEAAEVYALRLTLEPAAAAEGAKAATAADHAAAAAALGAFEAAQRRGDAGGAQRAHRDFHLALVRPGGAVTYQILERLQVLAERYVRLHLRPRGRETRARREHQALLAAYRARASDEVRELLAAHIRTTRDDLARELAL